MIEDYSFGKMKINGKSYTADVIIKDGEVSSWWRKRGHYVEPGDVGPFIHNAKVVIIGAGESGNMQVPEETRRFMAEKGVKVIVKKTADAVKSFNKEKEENKVGLFHLTC